MRGSRSHPGRRRTSTSGSRRQRRRGAASTSRALPRRRLLALRDDRLQRGGGGEDRRGRPRSRAPAGRVRSSVGNGAPPAGALADQQHPDAGGAAPLVRRRGRRRPAVRAGRQPPGRRGGVDEQRHAVARGQAATAATGCSGADLGVGYLHREHAAGPPGQRRAASASRSQPALRVDRHASTVPSPQKCRTTRRRRRAPRSARRRECTSRVPVAPAARAAARGAQRARRCVPDGGEADLVRSRTEQASATTSRALSSSSRALAAGAVQPQRVGPARVQRGQPGVPRGRVQRLGRRRVEVARRSRPRPGGRPAACATSHRKLPSARCVGRGSSQ